MAKKTTPLQHYDRFIGWCMMAAAALFVGNFIWEMVAKL